MLVSSSVAMLTAACGRDLQSETRSLGEVRSHADEPPDDKRSAVTRTSVLAIWPCGPCGVWEIIAV
jgi:hypothetical protein